MDVSDTPRRTAIELGNRAVRALSDTLADKLDEALIETDARTLRGLLTVVSGLLGEVNRCAGSDCMGRAIDGFRLWTPHARLAAETGRADEATHRAEAAEAALRQIASVGQVGGGHHLGLLTDWQDVARSQAWIAHAALATDGASATAVLPLAA